jgi:hypothetical protein
MCMKTQRKVRVGKHGTDPYTWEYVGVNIPARFATEEFIRDIWELVFPGYTESVKGWL